MLGTTGMDCRPIYWTDSKRWMMPSVDWMQRLSQTLRGDANSEAIVIVVVCSNKQVLSGWRSDASAKKLLEKWLSEDLSRWGWVTTVTNHQWNADPQPIQAALWEEK